MGFSILVARKKANIKQRDLAKDIGVSVATLIKWEKGEEIGNIRFKTMLKMAEILNSTVQELFLNDVVAPKEQ